MTQVRLITEGWRSGMTGTIGVTVSDRSGEQIAARSTSGITEEPSGSGRYVKTVNIDDDDFPIEHVWDDTVGFASGQIGLLIDASFNAPGQYLISHRIKTTDGQLVPGCEVVVTTTNTGDSDNVIRSGYTNDGGLIEFRLNPGTYYLWRNKRNFSFPDPVTFTVSESGSVTYN